MAAARSRPGRADGGGRGADRAPVRVGGLGLVAVALTLLATACGSGSAPAASSSAGAPAPGLSASSAIAPILRIPAAGHTVPGVLTIPAGESKADPATTAGSSAGPAASAAIPVVLLLHGDGGDDTGPGNLFVTLAAELAGRGIATLRIDFAGSGPSQQLQTALDYPGMVADTTAAVRFLAADPRFDPARIALLGYSRGGTVAATVAGATPAVAALVSWSGLIADGTDENPDAHDLARAAGHVVVDGWDFSLAWFDSIQASHALTDRAAYRGPELAVVGDRDGVVRPSVSENFIAVSKSPDKTLHAVVGADHGMGAGTPQAAETVAVTVDWLAGRLLAR